MGSINPRLQGALRSLKGACPTGCRPGGWICVQLALLLLPSSALLAGVLLLIAITVQRPLQQPPPLSRPEARWLLLLSALLLVGSAWAVRGWVAWVGLFNWLPFFWFFLAIQPYFTSGASRRRLGQWILAGTVPVIAVTLIQRISGHAGLLETLWGLIRWPMGYPARGSGLFDNPNVTAAWLAITLPFLVAACLQARPSLQRRGGAIAIAAAAGVALLINASRNAIATVPVIWALSCGRRGRLTVLFTCLGYAALVLLKLLHTTHGPMDAALDLAVPDLLIQKVQTMLQGTAGDDPGAFHRQRPAIYSAALSYLASHPWVGLGENGFGHVYNLDLMRLYGGRMPAAEIVHSHNLLLEFAVSHGLPALLLLMLVVGRAMAGALPLLWSRSEGLDRAWVLSALVMLWIHLWDLPSFDSRINLLDWMLVAAIAQITHSRASSPSPSRNP